MFYIVLNSIAVLVICMIMGFACRKRGLISGAGEGTLSVLLINVTLPCLIIVSMQKEFDQVLLKNSIMVLVISFAIHFAGYFFGLFLCRLLKAGQEERSIWTFSLVFSNLVYMGLPLVESIYGIEAVFYVSMANIAFNTLVFSLGIKIITMDAGAEKKGCNMKKMIFNLPILATAAGFLMFIFSISIPKAVYDAFSSVGQMTTPLSMIVIGSILAENDLKTVFFGWKMYILIFIRLILFPLGVYMILNIFIADKMIVGILTLLTGMPIAGLTAILSAQYGGNRNLGSKFVFISTVISIVTIPLLSLILDI